MSGICGLFNLDQAPVAQDELRAMTAMLERRGPQGTGRWQDGPIGLGHTLLTTTPELLYERQPFTHTDTGCVITADVRLDNRDELLAALDLSQRKDTTGDAELVLRSYLQWGDACLDHLLGDFAFAIWDPRHNVVFCARDHFGMRPLYYHHRQHRHFVFASSPQAILVLPQAPHRINNGRVADYLVPQLEWIDYDSTFFEDVFRLPVGHKAVVTPAGLKVTEYWRPTPGPEPGFSNDDEYRQAFVEVFTTAVESRLRTATETAGSMLSGGMDSGSITAIGKDIQKDRGRAPLSTFSAVRRKPIDENDNTPCAESLAINSAITMSSIAPTLIHPDSMATDYKVLMSGIEEPFDGGFVILKAIFLAAQRQDENVVLDGGAGDVVLGEGTYVARLMQRGQFRLALAEIAAEPSFWEGGSFASGLVRNARIAFAPEVVLKQIRGPIYRARTRKYLKDSLISRDFAASVNIQKRFERSRQTNGSGWTADYATERCDAIWPCVTAGRERYARLAASMRVEARDPFLDKRVVEFCSRLPGRFRLRDGWPKMILRETMTGRLPEKVLWARGKPHLGWVFVTALTNHSVARGELHIGTLEKELAEYVDSEVLSKTWQEYRSTGVVDQIHTAHVLSHWLREAKNRPIAPMSLDVS